WPHFGHSQASIRLTVPPRVLSARGGAGAWRRWDAGGRVQGAEFKVQGAGCSARAGLGFPPWTHGPIDPWTYRTTAPWTFPRPGGDAALPARGRGRGATATEAPDVRRAARCAGGTPRAGPRARRNPPDAPCSSDSR